MRGAKKRIEIQTFFFVVYFEFDFDILNQHEPESKHKSNLKIVFQ